MADIEDANRVRKGGKRLTPDMPSRFACSKAVVEGTSGGRHTGRSAQVANMAEFAVAPPSESPCSNLLKFLGVVIEKHVQCIGVAQSSHLLEPIHHAVIGEIFSCLGYATGRRVTKTA